MPVRIAAYALQQVPDLLRAVIQLLPLLPVVPASPTSQAEQTGDGDRHQHFQQRKTGYISCFHARQCALFSSGCQRQLMVMRASFRDNGDVA